MFFSVIKHNLLTNLTLWNCYSPISNSSVSYYFFSSRCIEIRILCDSFLVAKRYGKHEHFALHELNKNHHNENPQSATQKYKHKYKSVKIIKNNCKSNYYLLHFKSSGVMYSISCTQPSKNHFSYMCISLKYLTLSSYKKPFPSSGSLHCICAPPSALPSIIANLLELLPSTCNPRCGFWSPVLRVIHYRGQIFRVLVKSSSTV